MRHQGCVTRRRRTDNTCSRPSRRHQQHGEPLPTLATCLPRAPTSLSTTFSSLCLRDLLKEMRARILVLLVSLFAISSAASTMPVCFGIGLICSDPTADAILVSRLWFDVADELLAEQYLHHS